MSYLLDTNAISEANKSVPDKGFMQWFNQVDVTELYVSCITIGEIYKGIELLTDINRRKRLENNIAEIVEAFSNRILDIDSETSQIWSKIMADSIKRGQTAPSIDALIASQAIQHDLILITRNIKDFDQIKDLKLNCPWLSN